MTAKPTSSERIPNYIVKGIDCQDQATLAAIEQYARKRREHLDALNHQDFDEAELADEDEELANVKDDRDSTVVIKKIPCGKDRGGCPHGPYKYVITRQGGELNWDYRGRAPEE